VIDALVTCLVTFYWSNWDDLVQY